MLLLSHWRGSCGCRRQVLSKAEVDEAEMQQMYSERDIMGEVAHPFCVKLHAAYQDSNSLYLLLDWMPGNLPICGLQD